MKRLIILLGLLLLALPLTVAAQDDDPEEWFDVGYEAYWMDSDYETALDAFTRAIELDPQFAAAIAYRANVYRNLDDMRAAVDAIEIALAVDPELAVGYAIRSRMLLELDSEDLAPVFRDLERAMELDPDLWEAYYYRATVNYLVDPYQAWQDAYEAIQMGGDYPGSYNTRGMAQFKLGDYDAALADLSAAIWMDDDEAIFYENRARIYYANGDYQYSIDDMNRVIELEPDRFRAYYNRALSWDALGDCGRAVADYTQEIENYPDLPDPYVNRATCYIDMGQPELALADNEAVVLLTDDPLILGYAYNNMSTVYLDALGDAQFALIAIDNAIAAHPRIPMFHYNRGRVMLALEDYAGAVESFTNSIDLQPTRANAYYYRATAYIELDELVLALDDLRMAESLSPGSSCIMAARLNVEEMVEAQNMGFEQDIWEDGSSCFD